MASTTAKSDSDLDTGVALLVATPDEGRRMFDEAARHFMGMSGEEFLRRYDAGEFDDIADTAGHWQIMYLEGLIGFAREDP